jgi:hypothetical protein
VFVGDEVELDVGFAAARERLMQLAGSDLLLGPSEAAHDRATAGLARVGTPGLSKLVRVQVRDLASTEGSVGLAIRWEAIGSGSALFPVLDADITLVRAGERACLLGISGVYRPPLGFGLRIPNVPPQSGPPINPNVIRGTTLSPGTPLPPPRSPGLQPRRR